MGYTDYPILVFPSNLEIMINKGILIFLSALLMFNCKEENRLKANETPSTFTLTADLKNLEAEYLEYYEKDDSKPDGYRRDTLWVKDQKFTFTDSIKDYKIYFITIPEAVRGYTVKFGDKEYKVSVKAHLARMWFIGYPGAEINYEGTVDDFMVNAYPSDKEGINDDLAVINRQIFPILNQIDSMTVASSTGDFTDVEKKQMYEVRSKMYDSLKELKVDYFKSHSNSVAASYIFNDAYYRKNFTHQEAKEIFNGFDSTKLAGTPFYDEVKLRLEAVEKSGVGMQAPEVLTKNTLDGSEFKLSSLKGNYVLLDFWGTWCGPCMAEMPKIKEYYNKYGDKNFKVLGVNSGDAKPKWKKAIKEHNFNWTHIQTNDDNNLLIPFNVSSFPTKILIDPSGKIIYSSKNTESKVDMYQMLDDIFSK